MINEALQYKLRHGQIVKVRLVQYRRNLSARGFNFQLLCQLAVTIKHLHMRSDNFLGA